MRQNLIAALSLVVLILAAPFATNAMSVELVGKLESAVKSGDAEKLKALLKDQPNEFKDKKGLLQNYEMTGGRGPNEIDGQSLMSLATETNKTAFVTFNKDVVAILLENAAVAEPEHFLSVAMKPWPEAVELIMPRLPDDDAAGVMKKYFGNMKARYGSMSAEDQEADEANLQKHISISQSFIKKISEKCPKEKTEGKFCDARTAAAKFWKAIERQDAREQHAASPEGLLESACELRSEIAEQEAQIKNEKEVGRVSGVVNQAVLHEAGSKIVALRKDLTAIQTQYTTTAK